MHAETKSGLKLELTPFLYSADQWFMCGLLPDITTTKPIIQKSNV